MVGFNVCAVFSPDRSQLLMCLRRRDPYKGKYNMPGGHIEPGEDPMDAAYRELLEETAITRDDVELEHFMDFVYHRHDMRIEVYSGVLRHEVEVHGEENDLYWISLTENTQNLRETATSVISCVCSSDCSSGQRILDYHTIN